MQGYILMFKKNYIFLKIQQTKGATKKNKQTNRAEINKQNNLKFNHKRKIRKHNSDFHLKQAEIIIIKKFQQIVCQKQM